MTQEREREGWHRRGRNIISEGRMAQEREGYYI
jgi:hypothetical protein